jgi:hypothetical protein
VVVNHGELSRYMESKDSHPDIHDIVNARRSRAGEVVEHLKSCESCRLLSDMLQCARRDSQAEIVPPPNGLMIRSRAIARLIESRNPGRTLMGAAIFDSWTDRPALAVRDSAPGVERRLRWRAAQFSVELVGNRQLADWDFVARVYDGRKVSRQFILQAGSRKLVAGRGDCYHWSARRPTRRLQLLSPSLRIDLGSLLW